MKVEITNDTWERSQKFEHVGVGHQPSVHAGICNSHVSLPLQVYRLLVTATTSLDYVSSFEMNATTKMDTNFNFLLTEGGAVRVHGCK